jgi:hypothetical protein
MTVFRFASVQALGFRPDVNAWGTLTIVGEALYFQRNTACSDHEDASKNDHIIISLDFVALRDTLGIVRYQCSMCPSAPRVPLVNSKDLKETIVLSRFCYSALWAF